LINHDYGIKYHGDANLHGIDFSKKRMNYFNYLMRRVNLQILYLSKARTKGGWFTRFNIWFVVSIVSIPITIDLYHKYLSKFP